MIWFSEAARATSAPRTLRRAMLAVEQLETRDLLSAATLVVSSGIVLSNEGLADFVTAEYNALLHRAPENAGLQAWVTQLAMGAPPETVEAGIVASAEYFRNHGSNATQWVTGLYNDLLGRGSDSAGLNAWVNAVTTGVGRDQIGFAFAAGPEREGINITNDYVNFLKRSPETGAITFWRSFLAQGHNRNDVAIQILASNEFFNLRGGDASNFIIGVYQDILNRTPGTTEINGWINIYLQNLP
ncbi:MAG TPA: DUF4214 domain-containing protein [Gemmataceae bacterium]|jgi:hypothetical protein